MTDGTDGAAPSADGAAIAGTLAKHARDLEGLRNWLVTSPNLGDMPPNVLLSLGYSARTVEEAAEMLEACAEAMTRGRDVPLRRDSRGRIVPDHFAAEPRADGGGIGGDNGGDGTG